MRNKKNILIIGYGKWGKKVTNILKKISNIKHILRSKNNYKKLNLDKINWVFVLTPNITHFKIVKYFLNKKINVFCEKPLTFTYDKSLLLFKTAKKNKVDLYVDDVESYKKKKIFIKKNNIIVREKKDKGSARSLLYRLAYHDFYLLYSHLKFLKKTKIKLKKFKKKIIINLTNNHKNYHFIYDINSNQKMHKINYTDFRHYSNNPLYDMLENVLYKKKNITKNKKLSLFSNQLIDKILKKF